MCYLKEHPSTNTTFFLTFSHWLVVFIQEKNYRFETPHWRNIKKWHCWKVKNEAVEVDFRDHNVERKISIPVYLERQVFGIDGLIQLFNLIIVQLFIMKLRKAHVIWKKGEWAESLTEAPRCWSLWPAQREILSIKALPFNAVPSVWAGCEFPGNIVKECMTKRN